MTGPIEPERTVFGLKLLTVSQINEQVKYCLEEQFGLVAVAGEIADLARPRSGHVYFTLRDPRAQLAAVLWKGIAQGLAFPLEEGMEVVVLGRLTLYANRGTYQVVVSEILPRGVGDLRRALEELRRKLAAEGLFNEERKKPLPFLPLSIAVITLATGAAVHDIIRTALARFPRLRIRVIPVRVQGREAPGEIVEALRLADRPGVAEVILLGRGGGGIEDLWAFNTEPVVRAVAASTTPVVSCVGHETDVTLSDLAADVRASTPTRAAEIAVPILADVLERLNAARDRAVRAVRHLLGRLGAELRLLGARPGLSRPDRRLGEYRQFVDELAGRLDAGVCAAARNAYNQLDLVETRLAGLNPLTALQRGYTVTRFRGGGVVRTVAAVSSGDRLEIRFVDGVCGVEVRETREESLGGTTP